jgi:hypothetical protein
LNGKVFLFALDTGASSCIYDSSLTSLLGEPMGTQEVNTSDGITPIPVFQPPDATLGGLSLRMGSPVIAADLRWMREGTGEEGSRHLPSEISCGPCRCPVDGERDRV